MAIIAVKACGMVTAVGFNAASTLAAIRAGISNAKEENLWDSEVGEYLSASKVYLPHWWVGIGKLAELAAPAMHECLLQSKAPIEEVPIILGLASENRPYRFGNLEQSLMDEVQHRLGSRLHPQ